MPKSECGQTLLMLMITLSLISLLAMEGVTQTLLQLRMTSLVLQKQQALAQSEERSLNWMAQTHLQSPSLSYSTSHTMSDAPGADLNRDLDEGQDRELAMAANLHLAIEADELSGVIRILHWQEGDRDAP